MYSNSKHTRTGFTAIELLVCVSVVGLLVTIALPALQSAREAARLSQCRKNLKELALASHAFHDAHKSFPGAGYRFVELLPYIEQQNLHDEFARYSGTLPGRSDKGLLPLNQLPDGLTNVSTYICPSGQDDANQYEASYAANVGTLVSGLKIDEEGAVANGTATQHYNRQQDGVRIRDVYDGTSNTVLFAERKPGQAGDTLYSAQLGFPFTPLQMAIAVNESTETFLRESTVWNQWRVLHSDYYLQVMAPNGRDGTVVHNGPQSKSQLSPARGYHTGVTATAMADGSVRLFSDSTDLQVWQNTGSRDSR